MARGQIAHIRWCAGHSRRSGRRTCIAIHSPARPNPPGYATDTAHERGCADARTCAFAHARADEAHADAAPVPAFDDAWRMDSDALANSLHGRVVVLGEDVVLVVQGERSGVAMRDVGHLEGCIAVDDSEDGARVVQGSHEGVDAV